MEYSNMIRDSSEPNQRSVFNFDAYPGSNQTGFPWCQNSSPTGEKPLFTVPGGIPFNNPNPGIMPAFIPSPSQASSMFPQIPASFSFGNNAATFGTNVNQFIPSNENPFQFTSSNDFSGHRFGLGKRKCDSPPPFPPKQLITEEKMAEHMSKLHISSETASSFLEPESVKNKRLYMCEEMRKLQTDTLLPTALLGHLERPCTALVLWQPPQKITALSNSNNNNEDNEEMDNISRRPSIQKIIEIVEIDNNDANDGIDGEMELDS